jgi:tRNA (adenine22-N1)-methyltransferase
MKNVQLSERLFAAASLVPGGSRVADVGTDHGFVPIYLINENLAEHVVAMDVNEGPLERAREHVQEYGLDDRIELRLSDGLKELLEGEADTMVCAGMGGLLMMRILKEGDPVNKGIKTLILQPQSDLVNFRIYLRENNLVIDDEREIFEDGKYYTMMRVRADYVGERTPLEEAVLDIEKSAGCDRERALHICHRFGPVLIKKRDPVLKKYLEHELNVCNKILKKLSENEHTDRIRDIINKKNDITTVLSMY